MILAILQARVSSTRLPGKVVKPILGLPMLVRQVERLRRSHRIDKLVVATSTDASDNTLVKSCYEYGIECLRGSLDDVLDRFYQTALQFKPDYVVRLTGDCPLADPALIDKVIDYHLAGGYDYTSNTIEPTYPDGLDVEVMRYEVLEQAWREAALRSEREHVTLFIHKQPDRFKLGSVKSNCDISHLRWTVDEPEDLQLINLIYEALYPNNPTFTTQDVLAYLRQHPKLMVSNTIHERNAGLKKSLIEDKPAKEAKNNE